MDKPRQHLKEFIETTSQSPAPPEWLDELKELIGPGYVQTSDMEIAQHSYDWWPLAVKWRSLSKAPYSPQAVTRPVSTEQVSSILRWATAKKVPVTPWGWGSSVTGAPLAMQGGICLDMSEMSRTIALDVGNLLVKVQAGKLGIRLEEELNERGYTLNHSPQSLDRSSVGGWISTRATGQFSSRYGSIEDLAVAFTVVLPTGEIVETRLVPRAAVGPDIRHVFLGAEGTMGVVTEVTLRIFPVAEHRILEVVTFDTVEQGVAVMKAIMQHGLRPFLVRFYDVDEARHAMLDTSFDKCAMFLGFEGIESVAQAEYMAALAICAAHGGRQLGSQPVEKWMGRRFDFSTVEKLLAEPGGLAETIEVAHLWDGILETYYRLKTALSPLAAEVLGHFSHVYPHGSSLYMILLGRAEDDIQAEDTIMKIWDTAMGICLETGATLSHHHGVGIARLPYLRADLASAALVLEKVKAVIDPSGIMNPGKLIDE